MSRGAPGLATIAACLALALSPDAARAQDVVVSAQRAGRELPQAYYDAMQRDPRFFDIERGWTARTAAALARGAAVDGTLPVAVLLGLFQDSEEPFVASGDVQVALFDGPSEHGTVSALYSEMSGGGFTIGGQVLPWVRTDLTLAEVVGTDFGLGNSGRFGDYLLQVLELSDATTDFSVFDNDGPDGIPSSGDDDRFVDAVAIQFLEIAASCGGPSIWPHRSRVENRIGAPFLTNDTTRTGDPILINDYIMQGVTNCAGDSIQTATTIGHELGHVLGLPDFYDSTEGILPEQRRWVLGCWSLMAAGAWGCGTEDRETWNVPTHMSAFEKLQLGWVTAEAITGSFVDRVITLPPVQEGRRVLRFDVSPTEYFLAEYRTQDGFDRNLPSSGVLFFHVDLERFRRPCRECDKIYFNHLVEADGNNSLIRTFGEGGNRGEPGDAWAVTGTMRLTNGTTPSTRLNDGSATQLAFERIALEGGVASFTISTTTVAVDRLVAVFLGEQQALTADEQRALDESGNANGRYDLGDLRRYLLDHPTALDGPVAPTAR